VFVTVIAFETFTLLVVAGLVKNWSSRSTKIN
jgi:hypothetical protein